MLLRFVAMNLLALEKLSLQIILEYYQRKKINELNNALFIALGIET